MRERAGFLIWLVAFTFLQGLQSQENEAKPKVLSRDAASGRLVIASETTDDLTRNRGRGERPIFLDFLPKSEDARNDIVIRSLAFHSASSTLLWSTGSSIMSQDVGTKSQNELVSGNWLFTVTGYNLGSSREEVLSMSIGNVTCSSIISFGVHKVACLTGARALVGTSLDALKNDVTVTVLNRGSNRGITENAEVRYYDGVKRPMVGQVIMEDRGFLPGVIAVGSELLYWSNEKSNAIQRIYLNGTGLQDVKAGAYRINGLVLDREERYLYYSDASSGTIARLPIEDHSQVNPLLGFSSAEDIIVSGLTEPRGLVFDERSCRLYYTEFHGTIGVISTCGNAYSNKILIRQMTHVRLNAVAYYFPNPQASMAASNFSVVEDPTTLRLYWPEANTDQIKCSSAYGTRTQVLPNNPGYEGLIWPRGIAIDNNGSRIYVSEYFGRIWEFSIDGKKQKLLIDQPRSTAAMEVISKIRQDRARGLLSKRLFFEVMS